MSFCPEIDDKIEPIVRLVAVDRPNGLKALQELAEGGNKSAVLYLGLYLSEDVGTTELSLPWLLKANGFGSADAAWNLAMIARERGATDEMRHWIDRAAELGEDDARKIRENGYDVDGVLAG